MSISEGFIYKTTNLINNKIYIGKHKTSADDGYLGSGLILSYAVDKYGKENFKREIIEYCSSDVGKREEYWIDKLNARNSKIGYNIAKGGIGGDNFTNHPNKENIRKTFMGFLGKHHTEETKNKISKNNKGKKRKPLTEEQIEKLRQINTGKKRSNETKQKIRESKIGNKHPLFGKHHKQSTIEKMKNAQTKYNSPSNKYYFELSNNQNYWEFFTKNERNNINGKFREKHTNVIIFKNITITRKLKYEK